MVRLADKPSIYLELYGALAHFLGRQQLTVRAVVDQGVNPSDLQRGVAGWYDKTPQVGQWGDEWRFFFHGGGCRLTHNQTREPIDFNGTDPGQIDPYSFIQHLEWRLTRGDDLPHLRAYREVHQLFDIAKLIEELIQDGLVTPDYRLNAIPDPSQASAA